MKYIKIFAALILLLTLSSCGGTEPNDAAYVVGIGFDKGESEGNYIITIQYAKPTQISGGASEEGGKSGSQIVENLAVEAPDLYAGIALANQIVSKKFSLAHSKIVVFSAEVAKEGISDIMKTISRNEEIRPDIYLAVARDSARDYLFSVKPSVEINPSKYYQLIYQEQSEQTISDKSALKVYFNYKNNSKDNILPLAGVVSRETEEVLPQSLDIGEVNIEAGSNSDSKEDNSSEGGQEGEGSSEESQSSEGGGSEGGSSEAENPQETQNKEHNNAVKTSGGFEFNLSDYIAGQTSVNNNDKSEVMGMVIFKGDAAKLIVGSTEKELFKILSGNFTETYLTLRDDSNEAITLKIEQKHKPYIKIDRNKKQINISLSLESNIYSMPANYVSEKDIKKFEERAKKEITLACEKFIDDVIIKNDVDILGFKEKAKMLYLTNDSYKKSSGEVMNYDVNVKTEFIVRRTGLTFWED